MQYQKLTPEQKGLRRKRLDRNRIVGNLLDANRSMSRSEAIKIANKRVGIGRPNPPRNLKPVPKRLKWEYLRKEVPWLAVIQSQARDVYDSDEKGTAALVVSIEQVIRSAIARKITKQPFDCLFYSAKKTILANRQSRKAKR